MKPANYGPFYAAGLYPKLAEVFRAHGYALAVHGSLANDFDLIAVPWVENASHPQEVAEDCNAKFAAKFSVADSDPRPHGRIAYKLNLSFGDCALDVSFTPRVAPETGTDRTKAEREVFEIVHRGGLQEGYDANGSPVVEAKPGSTTCNATLATGMGSTLHCGLPARHDGMHRP